MQLKFAQVRDEDVVQSSLEFATKFQTFKFTTSAIYTVQFENYGRKLVYEKVNILQRIFFLLEVCYHELPFVTGVGLSARCTVHTAGRSRDYRSPSSRECECPHRWTIT